MDGTYWSAVLGLAGVDFPLSRSLERARASSDRDLSAPLPPSAVAAASARRPRSSGVGMRGVTGAATGVTAA
eukprot:10546395-Alexandrium_andersonii.AAC.1